MKIKSEEEIFKEKKENWIKLSEIIKFLETKGLEVKECIVFKSRSEYVKGKDLQDKLKENIVEVCDKINKDLKIKISPEKPDDAINEIYYQFRTVNLISKACREDGDKRKHVKKLLPYEKLALLNKCNCGKDHDDLENVDHPKLLDLNKVFSFDPSFYYLLNINRSKSKLYLYLFLIISVILLYNLLPVWPYQMKLALWWILYFLIVMILAIYIIRVLIYSFFYLFGYDIWLFPDLEDPKLGYIESFRKVISVEKRNDKWDDIVFRIFLIIFFTMVGFYVYQNPEKVDDVKDRMKIMIKYLYKYGENKFFNNNNNTLTKYKEKKYFSLEDLDNF